MRDFVREPEGDELGVESQPVGLGVCDTGEVLEADEGNAPSIDYQLACIGRPDTDHQDDIEVGIDIKQSATLFLGISGERNDVHSLEHRPKISPAGKSS